MLDESGFQPLRNKASKTYGVAIGYNEAGLWPFRVIFAIELHVRAGRSGLPTENKTTPSFRYG
jgi:hypothetical protein